MAATTISRKVWSDGALGTLIDNAEKNDFVYDRVDSLIANDITFGGLVNAEGLGTHGLSAGGTGVNRLRVENTTGGTGNYAAVELGNDLDTDIGRLEAYSGSWSGGTATQNANAVSVRAMGAGGLILSAEDAAGDVRLYANGTAKYATWDGDRLQLTGTDTGARTMSSVIHDSVVYADVGNAADTNWATLYSYTIPANTFTVDGQMLRLTVALVTDGNSKDVEIYLGGTGGTLLGSLTNNTTVKDCYVVFHIIRTGSNAQRCMIEYADIPWTSAVGFTDATETDSSSMEFLIRGKSDTSTANSIVRKFGYAEWLR